MKSKTHMRKSQVKSTSLNQERENTVGQKPEQYCLLIFMQI